MNIKELITETILDHPDVLEMLQEQLDLVDENLRDDRTDMKKPRVMKLVITLHDPRGAAHPDIMIGFETKLAPVFPVRSGYVTEGGTLRTYRTEETTNIFQGPKAVEEASG